MSLDQLSLLAGKGLDLRLTELKILPNLFYLNFRKTRGKSLLRLASPRRIRPHQVYHLTRIISFVTKSQNTGENKNLGNFVVDQLETNVRFGWKIRMNVQYSAVQIPSEWPGRYWHHGPNIYTDTKPSLSALLKGAQVWDTRSLGFSWFLHSTGGRLRG